MEPLETIETIKPINRETVHKICSGQVVLSLAIAVKELIENAIDASSTNIEIRLKDYGSELIEVLDNGVGVKEENFETLTLKHYTSKIQEFSDLESLKTMGFRGEALSSLCALCNLSIITRHQSAEYATKIEYDHNGKILNKNPAARCYGTTVTLTNLFTTLPVRRKEFVKNVKREFNKMCQLLYAYCLVCKNVKFLCTNTTSKGVKSVVVSTQASSTIKDNIIAIFSAKQTISVTKVDLVEPNEEILREYSLSHGQVEINFDFEFYISKAQHGSGRSTSDRQFYYVNERPCDPGRITKLINEIYRQFNCNQYPFVFLNIFLKRSEVDVNVTPDKRQIYLQQEKLILATIKASLLAVFKNAPSTYESQNLDVSKLLIEHSPERGVKRNQNSDNEDCDETSFLKAFKNKMDDNNKMLHKKPKISPTKTMEMKQSKLSDFKAANEKLDVLLDDQKKVDNFENDEKRLEEFTNKCTKREDEEPVRKTEVIRACTYEKQTKETEKVLTKEFLKQIKKTSRTNEQKENVSRTERASVEWSFTLEDIVNNLNHKREQKKDITVKFHSKILPNNNREAERELQKNFNKDSFKEMEVIGQFNLAFIIAKIKDDLFIIDQHASDEKYNFEQLQLTTVLENQKLVSSKLLELTAGNESLLMDNLDLFQKNGFEFDIKDTAEATKKIYLTTIPMSKNYIFGKDDIDEMLFMLKDSNITTCRPSKIRSMLASRACRKSVMVGRHLAKNEMKRIIEHMGDIEQPWNCPHGRPTMRHLINLDLIE